MPRLFEVSAYDYAEHLKQQAVAEVNALPVELLSDPALAGHLDKIAAKYSPEFLEIEAPSHADKIQKTIERDDYGCHNTAVIQYLEVSIPFKGDVKLLQVSPSSCSIPDLPIEVRGKSFVVTVQDDQNVGPRVERFCNSMRENFRAMKLDLENIYHNCERHSPKRPNVAFSKRKRTVRGTLVSHFL